MNTMERIDPGRVGADDIPVDSSPEAGMLEFATHMTTLTQLDPKVSDLVFKVHVPQFLKAAAQTPDELAELVDRTQRKVANDLATVRSITQKLIDGMMERGDLEQAERLQDRLTASTTFALDMFRAMGDVRLRLLQTAAV